jgi:hypothetical protein
MRFKPVNVVRALYGRMETKRAMNGIINVVTEQYKFSSLAQFNAVLGLYNIVADTGADGSRIKKHEGLVFRVLDEQGNKVGVPIKASDFASKPTLRNLRGKFEQNKLARETSKIRLKNAIDMALLNSKLDLQGLIEALRGKGIDLVIRRSADGQVFGMTYVDHAQKTVFNGSELGKVYSAKAILERCPHLGANEGKKQNDRSEKLEQRGYGQGGRSRGKNENNFVAGDGKNIPLGMFDVLLDAGEQRDGMDQELKRKKKKKKRVRLSQG